ncbi:MBL fold metallo-hydrolase, partial [Escherichia coli]|nr:MBL fold metallo-hydrolase [Escherichia coli]
MKIIQVRNATQLISYAGKKFLVDPMLAKQEAYPGFEGTARYDIRIPMPEVPFDLDVRLDGGPFLPPPTPPPTGEKGF